MEQTIFPSLEEAIYLHEKLIDRFGGARGIRDRGLLESALYRLQSGYYEALSVQAAALLQSLARNHAFVDGNKRMAFALPVVFLRLNGYALQVEAVKAEHFLVDQVICHHVELEAIAQWIERHMVSQVMSR